MKYFNTSVNTGDGVDLPGCAFLDVKLMQVKNEYGGEEASCSSSSSSSSEEEEEEYDSNLDLEADFPQGKCLQFIQVST